MDTSDRRLDEQIRFILEADKEKDILRQNYLPSGRHENDAEHAWSLALMAWLLKEYANEPVDIAHVMIMCLIHDIVEIDAGDTYAYDEQGRKTQQEREAKAAERIFSLLPEDQQKEMKALFEEFNRSETPEARFANALDRFQPLLMNDASNGISWKEHQIHRDQVESRQQKTKEGSETLYQKALQIIACNAGKGLL